jgi:vacuolar protein sorting-associated protein 54
MFLYAVGLFSLTGFVFDSSLAKRFRVLSFDEFFKILSLMFSALLQMLRRIALIHELLSAILRDSEKSGIVIGSDKISTEDLAPPKTPTSTGGSLAVDGPPPPPPKYSQLISESAEILLASAEYAHVRCGKLLTLRVEQNSQLNFKDFFKLFDLCWRFVVAGEAICQRTCVGLRGTVMSQASRFFAVKKYS